MGKMVNAQRAIEQLMLRVGFKDKKKNNWIKTMETMAEQRTRKIHWKQRVEDRKEQKNLR